MQIVAFSGPPIGSKLDFPNLGIIGGHDTDIESHPWQVSLRCRDWLDIRWCGGVLISDQWVITAAGCVVRTYTEQLFVVGGATHYSEGQEYEISQFIIHPLWETEMPEHNIALLQLAESVNSPSSAINLPTQGQEFEPGTNLSITGWGDSVEYSITGMEILQEIVVPTVSYQDCLIAYWNMTITDTMVCAGLLGVGGQDACGGDTGGPAALDNFLVGITSFGHGCGSERYPGVYTKISHYVDWIRNTTGINMN